MRKDRRDSWLANRLLACVCATAAALLPAAPARACCIGVHLQPLPRVRHVVAPLAIGDSVLLGAAHEVARAGFEVDAREGRFMRHALRILRHLRRDHRHPRLIVIAIGTNSPPTTAELHRALGLIRPDQTLALVTPFRSGSPLAEPAAWALHRRQPHRVRILDWAARATPHPSWFYGDGTHLRATGARAYARMLGALLHPMGIIEPAPPG